MDSKQFDAMLSDAEIRLRRLKVLYDQWFMGIERMEPSLLKKELEDLLAKLKREQVTNTAAKFRLQTIVQRHVTFTTYWRRIARQIEEGTFKRDLVRARKQKKRNPDDDDPELNYEIDVELDLDIDMDMDAALADAQEASERRLEPGAAAAPPLQPLAAANTGAVVPPIAAAPRIPMPAAPKPVPPPAVGGATAAAVPGKPAPPLPTGAAGKPVPPAAAAAVAALAATVGPKAAAAAAVRAAMPAPPTAAGPHAAASPGKPQPPATTSSGKPHASPLRSAEPNSAVNPGKPQPSRAAKPQVVAPKAPASAAQEQNGARPALSSEDVQRIYSNYVAARKQNAERTDNVKLDSIEKTLRGMLPQLEKKHAGKKIDFEVVVKDGKVALKPVAK